ncbi:helix-turn-helix domain-containing protein [Nakamurella sp. A5-74]|uniref:Helix-turn-helix domain-containing protein n=1 Tax=Nakamurella sp. A5-74 TaxID=3158264 RepID=A0AAU8DVL5_9ACTN
MIAGAPPPRAVVGTAALAALAVPARFALLSHLLAGGPRTASQCADVVGESASNCSWHLRALATVGLVERATPPAGTDARTRLWQAAAVGFEFGDESGPAAAVARRVIEGLSTEHEDHLHRRYLSREADLPTPWVDVAASNSYALRVTPGELTALIAEIDALIRPFVTPIRTDLPAGSEVAHLTLRAFLHPDLAPER